MVLVTPLFWTFGSISIGVWVALRFSLYIPSDIDEQIFRALVGKISSPIALSAILFFIIGVIGLLFATPPEITAYDIYFLILFAYISIFFLLGLKRINIVWPGRKLGTFNELLDKLSLKDYKKRMASKIYEAYKESDNEDDRKKMAQYIANLILP